MITTVSIPNYGISISAMSTTLGKYIRARREAMGFPTQTSFAKRAGINSAHLNQIESGKIALPSAAMRRAIAAALDVRHVDLLVAAGELASEEVVPMENVTSMAIQRLQPLIDDVRWDSAKFSTIESMLRLIADPERATAWGRSRGEEST